MNPMLTREAVSLPLEGFSVTIDGIAELPVRVCAEHLAWLGAGLEPANLDGMAVGKSNGDPSLPGLALRSKSSQSNADENIACSIRWLPEHMSEQEKPGALHSEAMIQALSGLMSVNGRDQALPRRLGLDVASVVAGIVATQGVLATLIANSRGQNIRGVETSVLQAGFTFLYHHLALATCDDPFVIASAESASAPGPPFQTADGYWVELEVLSFDSWISFWKQLGVERAGLEAAWSSFVYRYLAATCSLPATLHEATRRHSLAELRQVAGSYGVGICAVRTYPDILEELGLWKGGGIAQGADNSQSHTRAPWSILPQLEHQGERSTPIAGDAPLAGMRVVEVTSRLQGPLAGLLLQMLGAEVVKVEPIGGDFGRYAPPRAGSQGAAYLAYNRGKQVVELDYKTPEGHAQLIELIAGADVFLHNWRSGRAEKTGLDFERLVLINPQLVYAHASGWGRVESEPSPIAGDFLVQAHAGTGDGLNPADEPPFPSRVTLVDVTGGLLACEGILAGLYLREQTGQGCRVGTSLLSGAMELQAQVLKAIALDREQGRCWGRPIWGLLDRPIETADGFLLVSAEDDDARSRLGALCGLDELADKDTLEERIATRLHARSSAEWVELLRNAGIAATTVCTNLADLPRDPRIVGLLESVEDACWVPAAPWQFQT